MTQQEAPASGLTGPFPLGGPAVRWWWLFIAPLLAVLVVAAGAVAIVVSRGDSDGGDAHPMGAAAPLELASVSEDIAGHYRYAEAHQADLAVIACFCGCE